MKILLTGFEPFSDNAVNPSQKLLENLPEKINRDCHLQKIILPVDHEIAPRLVIATIREEKPDAVIAFGLANGRAKVLLEQVAINLMDFRIPDNAGVTISNKPVIQDGPTAFFTTLPIRSMLDALLEANIPAEISLSAGAYLCNQIFYTIMYETSRYLQQIKAGFVHLPALPEAAAKSEKSLPSMDISLALNAARILLSCLMSM